MREEDLRDGKKSSRKKSRTNSKPKATLRAFHDSNFPRKPEVALPKRAQIVQEDVLDVSSASVFYQKRAEITRHATQLVEFLGNARYRLKEEFRKFFLRELQMRLQTDARPPGDAAADALFSIASFWLEASRDNSNSNPRRDQKRDLLKKWQELSVLWRKFIRSGQPSWRSVCYEAQPNGTLLLSSDKSTDDIELGVTLEMATGPEMRIVLGGPAILPLFTDWMRTRGDASGISHFAAEMSSPLLSLISRELRIMFGLQKNARGRPKEDKGAVAAYLRHHQGKSARETAKLMGLLEEIKQENAIDLAIDRINKNVDNYYASLERRFKSLIKSEQIL